ncbi:MAG TPA: rod shape-determining protein MreC [Anaerolineae bacterium]|nr:rod shape-determining protein MreC [Anaerolineae bacterium]
MLRRLIDSPMVLLVLAVLCVGGIALRETGHLQPVEGLAVDLMVPLQQGLSRFGNRVAGTIETVRQLDTLQRENRELRELVDQLMIENVRLSEAAAENEILRQQLNFKRKNPSLDIRSADVIGRVIGRDPSNILRVLIIDVGARDGVAPGMPVVTARGLVGHITEVSDRSARVLLITDASSSVNALVQRSRATGVVRGQIGGNLVMRYIAQGEDVQVGDIVLTSGLGGNYPKRLVIGQITAVRQRDIDLFQEAEVRPTVNFGGLEVVMVITDFTPIQ